jgi:hypothetical protein
MQGLHVRSRTQGRASTGNWFVLGVCTVAAAACSNELRIKRGDEVYSILEEAVVGVSLRTPNRKAKVSRETPEHSLQYRFEDSHKLVEQCTATEELNRGLSRALEIRAKSVLTDEQSKAFAEAHKPDTWSELEIRSIMTDSEPFRLRLQVDPASKLVHAQLPGDRQVFTVDPGVVELVSLHCPK